MAYKIKKQKRYKGKIIDAFGHYWKTLTFKSKREADDFKKHFKKVAPKIKIILRPK